MEGWGAERGKIVLPETRRDARSRSVATGAVETVSSRPRSIGADDVRRRILQSAEGTPSSLRRRQPCAGWWVRDELGSEREDIPTYPLQAGVHPGDNK